MVPELKELRNEIDEVDRALVALFVRRMGISGAVAQVKRQKGLPVLDRTREEQLLRRVAELAGPDYGTETAALYETILSLSRARQQTLLEG